MTYIYWDNNKIREEKELIEGACESISSETIPNLICSVRAFFEEVKYFPACELEDLERMKEEAFDSVRFLYNELQWLYEEAKDIIEDIKKNDS